MNRKQFLKACACTLSCCAAGQSVTAAADAAESPQPQDWRLPFVRRRYAKLIEILAGNLDEAALNEILRQMGYACASGYSLLRKYKGDVDGFIREFKQQHNEDITYDREKGTVTVVGPERNDCFCPLIDKNLTSSVICNCSLGWQQCVYETLLGRKVQAELKESVLRGGKRCAFEIRVSAEPTMQNGG